MSKTKYKLGFYVLLILFLKPEVALAQLMWDNFEYQAGTLLTSNGWVAFNSPGVNPITVTSGNLFYNGYFTSGAGNSVLLSGAGGEDVGANFTICNSGSVYCAFLVKVNTASQNGEFFFHFGTSSSGTDVRGRVFVKSVLNNIAFGISKANQHPVYTNAVYYVDSVYLLVLKYTFVNGNSVDDIVNLFINPSLQGLEPVPDLTTGAGENDATNNISNIALRQGDPGDAPSLIIDGLRIAVSWQEGPLPVNLLYFNSSVKSSDVKLNWETSFEINNKGFELERKYATGNEPWKFISFIMGSGTIWSNVFYSFTDKVTSSGLYNYRLKQVDYNGSFVYYDLNEAVNISAPGNFKLNQNYPNPANPTTKISYELQLTNNVYISVFDVTGKEIAVLVNEKQNAGFYTVEWNASNYSSGVYFYKITAGNFSETKKMILIK